MSDAAHEGGQRLDQWLCYARFFKTRSLAAKIIKTKGVRIDNMPKSRASALVRPGQTLTFVAGERIRVVTVLGLAERRGPATEAALLYEDKSPPAPKKERPALHREAGAGRPTKKDRRALNRLKEDGHA